MDIYLLSLVSRSMSGTGPYDNSIKTLDFSLSPLAPQVHSAKPGSTAKGKFNFKCLCSVHVYTLHFWSKSEGEYLTAYHIAGTLERLQFGEFFEDH